MPSDIDRAEFIEKQHTIPSTVYAFLKGLEVTTRVVSYQLGTRLGNTTTSSLLTSGKIFEMLVVDVDHSQHYRLPIGSGTPVLQLIDFTARFTAFYFAF